MEQISKQITQSLIQELPESKYFTPQELLTSGIPRVVVETLRKNVASTIESGMNLPATDWVQTDSENVEAAWRAFVDISKQHVRIPAKKISNLLEEAVEECLELAVKPRRAVPETLFKARKEIDFETAKARVLNLEVNKQLGVALLRYMEKKEKSRITIDQARELVKRIDEKLVENYHPLNWAQLFKPVFELAGPEADSDLFRIFFEDKEMHKVARKFDLLEKKVTETEFIEIMSSAELPNVDELGDDQPQLFVSSEEEELESDSNESVENAALKTDMEEEPEKEPAAEQEDFDEKAIDEPEASLEDAEPEDDEPEGGLEEEETGEEPDEREENVVNLFAQIKKGEGLEEDLYYLEKEEDRGLSLVESENEDDQEDDNITLLNKFMFDESESDDHGDDHEQTESESTVQKDPSSIYEEMNLVKEDQNRTGQMSGVFDEMADKEDETSDDKKETDEESDEEFSYQIIAREDDEPENLLEDSEPAEEETDEPDEKDDDDPPMWRSFLERDDLEAGSGYEYEKDEEDEEEPEEELKDEDGFIEEPIYDLTVTEEDPEEKIKDISKWLDDEKDRFVQEIFRNSERAYEQALIEIIEFEDWKSASHYLEREVFSRNRIEVYDEVAVDFTDRLHSYFMENKS